MISYKKISYGLASFNLLLFLVVVFSPCWFAYYADLDLYYMGFWLICSEKFICRFLSDFDAYLIISRIALILCFIASVTSIVWIRFGKRNKFCGCPFLCPSQALVVSILNFTAGLTLLVAMFTFEATMNSKKSIPAHKKKWSFYFSYIILINWFFIGIYNFVCYKYSLWVAMTYSGNLSSPRMENEQLQSPVEQIDQNPG